MKHKSAILWALLALATLGLIAQDVLVSNRTVKWNKERNVTSINLTRAPLLDSWRCDVGGFTWERDTNTNERINAEHWVVSVPANHFTNLPAWDNFQNQLRRMVMKTNWDAYFPPLVP